MGFNKKFFTTGGIVASSAAPTPAGLDPLQNFETVAYTGNGGTQKITGYIRKGAAFGATSTSDGIVSGYAPSDMDTTSYTFSQFLFFDNINDEQYIFSNFLNSSGNYGFYALKTNNVGTIIIDLFNTSNVNTRITSTALSAGQWYHLALTWNHSTKVMKLYIDGALDQTSSALSGTVSTNSNTLRYGRSDGAAQNDLLVGKLDQIRIFNAELDQPKIQELADEAYGDATVSTVDFGGYGGVALYELDEDASDTGDTYDGTPTNVNFLGMAFQPDLVWIKDRDNTRDHLLYDSIREAGFFIRSNTTDAQNTSYDSTRLTSFDSNGFTVGSATGNNANNIDYVAWCWKAGSAAVSNTDGTITSTVSANQDAGFSIVEVDFGTNSTETVGHGLNQAPEFIISKRTSTTSNWDCYHKYIDATAPENYIISLNLSGARIDNNTRWNDTAPTNSVFTTGSQFDNNETVIFYCFHSVDGYQKVGSYTGNNPNTVTVDLGFVPRWIMIKAYANYPGGSYWSIVDVVRESSLDALLYANVSDAEASISSNTTFMQPLSIANGDSVDGFSTTGANSAFNYNGASYLYLAIA